VEMSSKKRSYWPLVILSTASTFFSLLLPLVLVRILSANDVGNFKIFFLYVTLIPAISLSSGIISGLPFWAGGGEKGVKIIKTSSMILIALAAIFVLLGLMFSSQISRLFGWTDGEAVIFSFALFGGIAAAFFEEAAISNGWIWTGAIFNSVFEFLRVALMLFAAYFYRSLSAVLLAHTSIISLKVLFGYVWGLKLGLTGFVLDKEAFHSVARYAFPVSLAWVFGIFVNSADQFILSTSIAPDLFAFYSIGCLTVPPLLIYEHSVTRVLIPEMSEAFGSSNIKKAAELYRGAISNLSFLLVPAVAGLIVFSKPIIELLFTVKYLEAYKYLQFYALTYLFLIIPYDALARAKGESKWILKTFMIFSAVSLILAYIFTVQWGPMGALCAILLSGLLMRVYSIIYFKHNTSLPLSEFLPIKEFAQQLFLSGLLSFGALESRKLFSNDLSWLMVSGGAFAVLYVLSALFFKSMANGRFNPDGTAVLIVTQTLEIGGLERMVLSLCEYLKNEGHWNSHVFAYDHLEEQGRSLIPDFKKKNIPYESFKKRRGFSPMVIIRMLKNIYRNNICIIHTQDLGGLIYAVPAKLLTFGKVSLIHTQHSFIHLSRHRRYRLYEKLLTRFIDKLSVVSEDTKKTYLDLGVHNDKIYVIENGVEFFSSPLLSRASRIGARSELIKNLGEKSGQLLSDFKNDYWILYLARFFPGKGQEHALKLWEELDPALRKKSVLCLIGPESADGEYDRVSNLVKHCCDAERIILAGPTRDPQSWLRVSDLYLSCSEFEGMPLGPLEAVGSGVPALLSDIPGHDFLKNMAQQYSLGQIKEGAREIENIIKKVQEVDEELFRELWKKGENLRNIFSIERMSGRYSALYRERAAVKPGPLMMEQTYG
jgi:O-antigen/teichoic acid export membrane protein/glycosyltransferase involved in cell wall biosynthesis